MISNIVYDHFETIVKLFNGQAILVLSTATLLQFMMHHFLCACMEDISMVRPVYNVILHKIRNDNCRKEQTCLSSKQHILNGYMESFS